MAGEKTASPFFIRSCKELVQQHRLTSKTVGGASGFPTLNTFTVIALRFYMSLFILCLYDRLPLFFVTFFVLFEFIL